MLAVRAAAPTASRILWELRINARASAQNSAINVQPLSGFRRTLGQMKLASAFSVPEPSLRLERLLMDAPASADASQEACSTTHM